MHAAPMELMEAVWVGSFAPCWIMSAMLKATWRPMTPEGMPVRGGAGEMTVPLGLFRGREIGCGGAKAMPTPNRLGYLGVIYVRGQSAARHSSNGFAV